MTVIDDRPTAEAVGATGGGWMGADGLLHPQPVGVLDPPAAFLLLPAVEGARAVAEALVRGGWPVSWPDALAFVPAAVAGDVASALALLPDGDDPVLRFDRFALAPTAEAHAELRASLPQPLATLVDVVAFAAGLVDEAPEATGLQGELRGVAALAAAGAAFERGNTCAGLDALVDAAAAARDHSPLLAAQLLAMAAEVRHQHRGADREVLHAYADAIALAGTEPAVAELVAGWWFACGTVAQELSGSARELLVEATRCYQQALRTFRRSSHPEQYAQLQVNLALAYLALPMTDAGDKLRSAVAVQALREALRVYGPETHPREWASAQLNLATALQHLPSAHQRENLVEAVGCYEQLLQHAPLATDPLGRARLLANQGNALAHLGARDAAAELLAESAAVFAAAGDADGAAAVHELLAGVRDGRG